MTTIKATGKAMCKSCNRETDFMWKLTNEINLQLRCSECPNYAVIYETAWTYEYKQEEEH